MKNTLRTVCTLTAALCLLIAATTHADSHELKWYKGNTHTHTFWSDGNDFPESVAMWYRTNGYNFLVLSDHNILSQGEKWVTQKLIDQRKAEAAVGRAEELFGKDHIITRGEGDAREYKLKTLPQIKSLVETENFIMVQGEEISDGFNGLPIHTNAMNIEKLIPAPKGKSLREAMRNAILTVEAQAKEIGRPMLAHLNHPNFHYAITAEDLAHVTEEKFYEVYNGHPGVGHMGDEKHPPVERLWDIANTIRLGQLNAAPMMAVATDDSHTYFDGQTVTPGRGWVMVQAEKLTGDALVTAMQQGHFYASTGVTLQDVTYKDGQLDVTIEAESGVTYTIEFIGTLAGYDASVKPVKDDKGRTITGHYSKDVGRVLSTTTVTLTGSNAPMTAKASYAFGGTELYVRAAIRSNKPHPNPSYQDQMIEAWTQPFGWEKHLK